MLDVLVMPITYRCNCNCIMCSIPTRKTNDMPVEFYDKIFDDNILNKIKSINITGGEPFLRTDIGQILEIVIRKCDYLKEVIFSSNGMVDSCISIFEKILVQYPNHKFIVSISLDSLNKNADIIRGRDGVFYKQSNVINGLKDLEGKFSNLKVVASMTITKVNCNDIFEVFEWAKRNEVLVDFIYATINTAYINSKEKQDLFALNHNEIIKIVDDLKLIYKNRIIASDNQYYENLFKKLMTNNKEVKSCIYRERRGVLIEADGSVRICGMDEKLFLGDLNKQNFSDIFKNKDLDMDNICGSCITNSYNAYSKKSQNKLLEDILNEIKRLRK